MRTFTCNSLGVTLSPLRLRMLLQRTRQGKITQLTDLELTVGESLLLWTADWLSKRKPISDEQQSLLLSEFAEDISKAAVTIERNIDGNNGRELEAFQLVVLDNTLAGMSGLPGYLDLRTGENVDGPRQMPIEIISINLTALYCFHRQRLTERKK